jgi:hypothetical protein
MSGLQGPVGFAGPAGMTGITGRRGRQGDPFGPQGVNLFSPGGRLTTTTVSTNPFTLSTSAYGTNYLIGITGPTGPTGLASGWPAGYITTATLPASMSAADVGAYWVLTNYTSLQVQVNLSNATAVYKGSNAATTIYLGSSLALAYSGTGTSYIVL